MIKALYLLVKGLTINREIERRKYINILNEIEHLFHRGFDYSKLKKTKQNDILTKMRSFNREDNQSQGIFHELYLFTQLKKNTNISEIIYEDFSGSNHDFRFKIKETEFNLEVTGLGENEVDIIIQKSFKNAGRMFIEDIPMNSCITLNINIKSLKKCNKKFIEQHITNLLSTAIQNIFPVILTFETYGTFDKDFQGDTSCSLNHFYNDYTRLESNYSKSKNISLDIPKDLINTFERMSRTKEGIEYLKNTKIDDLINTPIVSYSHSKCIGKKCLQISSWNFYPSIEEKERRKAKLNQFKKSLTSKLEKHQLKHQKNPIIVIQFMDFYFHDYSSDVFTRDEFLKQIRPIVAQCFITESHKNTNDILGVIIYEEDLSKGVFVNNPLITIDQKIINNIDLMVRVIK